MDEERACASHIPHKQTYAAESGMSSAKQGQRQSRIVALVIGVATLMAASLGLYFFIDQKGYKLKKSNDVNDNFQGQVSMSEMAAHTEPEDCWMELHGNVYDLTDYAPDHPGGPEYVTDYCGMNATRFYDMEHSTSLLTLVSQYNLGTAVSDDFASEAAAPGDASAPSSPVGGSGDADSDEEESGDAPQNPPPAPTSQGPTPAPPPPASSPQGPTPADGCPVQYYAAATVAEHGDEFDCWYTLYGTVYDLTVYVNEHPGGKHPRQPLRSMDIFSRRMAHCTTNEPTSPHFYSPSLSTTSFLESISLAARVRRSPSCL